MNTKTGCIIDHFDPRDVAYHPAGAALVTSDDVDHRDALPAVRNQLKQNCCGHAVRAQLFANSALNGSPIAEPSTDLLYVAAQLIDRPRQPLRDDGSKLREMCRAMSRRSVLGPGGFGVGFGIAPEIVWPESAEHVIPPDDVWRYAEACTISGYSFIPDGSRSSDLILQALRRRRLPTICFLVDEKFTQIADEVYHVPGGRIIGSHCMVCCGFSRTLNAIMVQNSWGEDFGDRGYAWISTDFVNRNTYGKVVIEPVPGRALGS